VPTGFPVRVLRTKRSERGTTASSGPWAARLFVDGRQNCTATIIAPQYILTAKHCVSSA
jgi:V8-like Glu-specific endopeptidase